MVSSPGHSENVHFNSVGGHMPGMPPRFTNGQQHMMDSESIFVVLSMFMLLMYLLLVPCILVSRINKLKKRLFYIYLLTTITKALYQPSEKGMSLLFTCPQLTEESSSLLAAARTWLHIMQYISAR